MSQNAQFDYAPLFDDSRQPAIHRERGYGESVSAADRGPADWYVFDDAIRLRINIALATGRPLLVRGPSGCGKSSLARAIAARAGWNYAVRVIDSRTQAQDLLYQIDNLKRLQDAQKGALNPSESVYVRPGPLFWAFDADQCCMLLEATDRKALIPAGFKAAAPWVLLVDEIDKADPDVPNNLLVPLGSLEFAVPELSIVVKADGSRLPLILATTNEERELPPAFLRRCVELVIGEPDAAQLQRVATEHKLHKLDEDVAVDLADLAQRYMRAPRPSDQPRNVAEFLDFVRACRELELMGDEATSEAVLEAICGRKSR